MAIFELQSRLLKKIEETTFEAEGIKERRDLQSLLREQIEVVIKDVLIVAEEFGDWEDSRRRIDLLGLDKDANLVVIELKRKEDEVHELQAIRYAAMISTMTFEKLIEKSQSFYRRTEMAIVTPAPR
jgi:RecB family endonuclease NucS